MTKETCFSNEEESTLLETTAELGYGCSKSQLQFTAGKLALDPGKKRAATHP